MNIGIFTDTYYPNVNGVVTSVATLRRELQNMGHVVYIFAPDDPEADAREEKNSRIYRLPSMPFMFLPTQRVALLYPPKLIVKMRKFKLDVIHTQSEFTVGIFGKIVSELLGVPLVHTYHTMYVDYVHYIFKGRLISPNAAKKYSRIFCNGAKAVIAPVEKTKTSLLSYGVCRPIHVIPTGIDFTPFRRHECAAREAAALREAYGLDGGAKVLLSVGRVAREKSMHIIVSQMPAILSKIPNAKLVIVGDGPARAELEQLCEDLDVAGSVVFVGMRPWTEIAKYYRMGDIFVSASTSETQGLTYIEAIASGLPVVMKRDDSIEGILEDGKNAYIFDNDGELAEILANAIADEAKLREINENAQRVISRFDSRTFMESCLSLYETVIQEAHAHKTEKSENRAKRRQNGIKIPPLPSIKAINPFRKKEQDHDNY